MKTMKRTLSALLCLVMLFGCFSTAATALPADGAWEEYYGEYLQEGSAAFMSPGKDETERNFSWYSPLDAGTARVVVSESEDFSKARTFTGTFVKTPEGDRSNKVTVTGLWPGRTYFYKCVTDLGETETATFSTVEGTSFTAMYTTDIHVSKNEGDEPEKSLVNHAYTFSEVLTQAGEKEKLDLVISAGDQATRGYRSEYMGLVSSPVLRSVPFAPCVGNHDRKGIAYKYFTNNPNEYKKAQVSPFISYDYYYVKGDAIFFVFDSNCGAMIDHRNFVKDALKKNPDVKWRIATFHHDLYGQRIPHREDENKFLRTIWAPIMDEFAFDLVLLGHSHYFTITNAMFGNTTNQSLVGLDSVKDPKGAVVMVSGSINHPRTAEGEEEPPVGDNVAFSYLSEDPIYNLLDFTEDSITIRSYVVNEDEPFHSFTIEKTSRQGGHPENGKDWYDPIIRALAQVYGFFNEVGTTAKLRINWKDYVGQ